MSRDCQDLRAVDFLKGIEATRMGSDPGSSPRGAKSL